MSATRTAYATCPLCEATCGLEFEIGEGERVLRIRGDADDALSHGFVCPKGASLKPLHEDPDRLRTPLVRRNGRLEEATWDEAFAEVERRLPPLLEEHANEHHFVRPGTDALLLFGLVHTIFDERLDDPGPVGEHVDGLDVVRELARDFAPERVADACGIEAPEIRRMARELAAASSAGVYGRIGTCTQEFGTLASWLVDVLNVVTGNLDRPGGAMFPRAAAGQPNSLGAPGSGRGVTFGRWHSRVRGLPEVYGELPVSCLA